MAIVGRFIRNFQESDCLSTVHNGHNQGPCYRKVSFRYMQALIRKEAPFFYESSPPDTTPFLTRVYYRLIGNLTLFPDVSGHRGDNQDTMFIYVAKDPVLTFHSLQDNLQHFSKHFLIWNGEKYLSDLVPDS